MVFLIEMRCWTALTAELTEQLEHETHKFEELWRESVRMQNTLFAELGLPQHPAVSGSWLDSLKKVSRSLTTATLSIAR